MYIGYGPLILPFAFLPFAFCPLPFVLMVQRLKEVAVSLSAIK